MANIVILHHYVTETLVYFMIHFVKEDGFRTGQWLSLKDKENVSNCDAVDFRFKQNWESHVIGRISRDSSLGWRCCSPEPCTTVISSISPSLHFQTFPLVKLAALCYWGPTEHVPILLRAIALKDSTCSESTRLNALRQDYIFLFVYLLYFHDFVMLLGSYSF